MLFNLILYLYLFNTVSSNNINNCINNYNNYPNILLNASDNNIISNLNNSNLIDCSNKCSNLLNCVTFNYFHKKSECQLLDNYNNYQLVKVKNSILYLKTNSPCYNSIDCDGNIVLFILSFSLLFTLMIYCAYINRTIFNYQRREVTGYNTI